jgi:peptidoglycan/LPS O-acetylase OafA/YrhL
MFTTLFLAYNRKWSVNTFDGAAVARFETEGYAKPHIRAQIYLAGMLLGITLQDKLLRLTVNWKTRLAMAVAILTLGTVTFITVTGAYARRACNFKEWPDLNQCGSTWSASQTFWYTGMSRVFWAVGLGVLCFLCLQGAGGLINTFLTLHIWTPLSHLSFGAYLVHPIVIFTYQFGSRQKEPFRLSTFGLDYLSVSMVSFGLALLFTLVVELPCAHLSKRLLSRRRKVEQPCPSDSEFLLTHLPSSPHGNQYGAIGNHDDGDDDDENHNGCRRVVG